jgi:1,4-alpha-glucan branching enzyme
MLFEKHAQRTWTLQEQRVLSAMMRQLVLAQASDWPFLVSTGSASEYASMRFHNHVVDALALADAVERLAGGGTLTDDDHTVLDGVEQRDALFPEILDVLDIRMETSTS